MSLTPLSFIRGIHTSGLSFLQGEIDRAAFLLLIEKRLKERGLPEKSLLQYNQLVKAYFRFYQELNDFLKPTLRNSVVEFTAIQKATVKDAMESLGVPHPEVDLILINGESAPFSAILRDQDHVSVFPMFRSLEIDSVTKLRPRSLLRSSGPGAKFTVDANLGKLAHLLRMLGFDVAFDIHRHADEDLAKTSAWEKRILLTRDRDLLKRKIVEQGYYVRETRPKEQVIEVLRRFNLGDRIALCTRCIDCNVPIVEVRKVSVAFLLPERVAEGYSRFFRCPQCHKVFWYGSHYGSMANFCRQVRDRIVAP